MECKARNKFAHVSKACSQFTTNFHRVLTSDSRNNVVSSPFSAHMILSLLYHGAKEQTEQELKSGLHLTDLVHFRHELDHLLPALYNVDQVTLNVANAVFVQDKVQLVQDFLSAAKKHFGSHVANVDFNKNVAAANFINAWIADKTNGNLKDAINSENIDMSTKIVLVNALYFKGKWLHAFNPEHTTEQLFTASENKEYKVQMMCQKGHFVNGTIESLDASILEIPYMNKDIDMIIILPNEVFGLERLEKKFDWNEITKYKALPSTSIKVYLPRFKFEAEINLKETLEKLGMKAMFSNAANFERMASLPLNVSQVLQKIIINVNEEGAEAAAATVVHTLTRGLELTPGFVVDHPFMFAIRHKPSNVPLFIGSVRDLKSV